jgi:uncharacterized protein (DUF433 family)
MNWQDHIEIRPGVLCGKPVFKGTRLGVQHILEKMAAGYTEADLLSAFPLLTPELIRAALSFAAESIGLDERAFPGSA